MKTSFDRIFYFMFLIPVALIIVTNFLHRPPEFSEDENRWLAEFPEFSAETLVGGEYMGKVDTYLDDHFIFRDYWMGARSTLEFALGKRESNDVFIGDDALLGRLRAPDERKTAKNIAAINSFVAKYSLPAVVAVVPSAAEIESARLPAFAQVWDQRSEIERIYSGLEASTCLPVYDAFAAHSEEYIYYRTDHHWTTSGAYLAYELYCEAAGLSPSPYSATTVSESFNGTLYSSSGVRFISSDSIEAFNTPYDAGCEVFASREGKKYPSIYFEEYLDKKDKYSYFLGQNQPVVKLFGSAGTGKKLLVFKDSYSHCLAPMLLAHYDEVALVDPRYANGGLDGIISPENYDAVLILCGIENFTSTTDLAKLDFLF